MEKRTLREKEMLLMGRSVLELKDTMKKWYNHAGIRFLQTRQLTDEQEEFLEDITEFINDSIDKLEEDESFVRNVLLPPVEFPQKKQKKVKV